jgi:arylsulfatase A-like enzyme
MRFFLTILTANFVFSGARPQVRGKATTEKPNIILLLTDDQDIVTHSLDYMPTLNRLLIERGTKFNNAFVHTPLCCPSRMSILSGRYLHNIHGGKGVNNSISGGCDNRDEWREDAEKASFAMYAKAEGYHTSYAGKYLSAMNDGAVDGDPLRGTPGCDTCLRVPPGKWFSDLAI